MRMPQASRRTARRLAGPATIGIVAPSGAVDRAALDRSVSYLERRGHRAVVAPQSYTQWRYFAGQDAARLEALHAMLADPAIDLLMAARGGYGWTRLLDGVDFDLLAASDKTLVGFSDFTAFSLAALACAGCVTFAGPMAAPDFGGATVSDFTELNFWPLLGNATHRVELACEQSYPPQTLGGTIWGGNLSLIAHLAGTRFMPQIDGGILVVEDIAEEPYRVERMFYQLHHAGILGRQRALLLGDFENCVPTAISRYPYTMAEVVETLRGLLPGPVLTGVPFGHVRDKITVPIGGECRVEIGAGRLALEFGAYND